MSKPLRILIAEDDNFIRTLLEAQCSSMGMQVTAVEDGAQAVTEALSYQYDVILTDIQMPQCDGLTAMHMLRKLGYDRPVIAMSADPIDDGGFDIVLQKPVDMAILAKLLQQAIPQQTVALEIDTQLISLFYQNLRELSAEFDHALQQSKRDLMRQICHKIKGGAASFGETELAASADKLQRLIQSDIAMADIINQCEHFASQLSRFGDKHA